MIRDDDLEALLADWLEDGPVEAPDEPVEAAIAHAHRRPRRRWRRSWPLAGMRTADVVEPVPTWRVAPRVRLAWALVVLGAILALLAMTLLGSRPRVVALPGNGLLAFSSDGDIWTQEVVPLREPGDRTVGGLEDASAPTWSPDGDLLAFRVETLTEPRAFRIEVMDVASGERRIAAEGGHASSGRLAFSPDGTLLAFGQSGDTLARLTIVAVDGSEPARTVAGLVGTSPSFSPDGTRIAFTGRAPESARTDVYLADVATLRATRLTREGQLGLGWADSPSWAEDGRTIVFEVASVDASGTMHHHIYAVGPDGSGLRRLGPAAGWHDTDDFAAAPVVSGDGRLVAFQGAGALHIIDVRSGADVGPSLADLRLGPGGIAWAPDASRIAILGRAACADPAVGDDCPELLAISPVPHPGGPATLLWHLPGPSFTWDLAWQPVPASPEAAP